MSSRRDPGPGLDPVRPLWPDLLAVAPVTLVIAITFGAATVAAGFGAGEAVAISAVMFSGAAQFAAVGIIAAGGSAVAAWATAMLISARFAILGLGVAARLRLRGWRRIVASFLVVDPNALIVASREDDDEARRAFWALSWLLYVAFIGGTALGAFGGGFIAERFTHLAIDVALPSFLAGLVVQSMRSTETRLAPLLGIAVTSGLLLAVGPELAVLLAPLGALVLVVPWVERRTRAVAR